MMPIKHPARSPINERARQQSLTQEEERRNSMRFAKMLTMVRVLKLSTVMAAVMATSSGCAVPGPQEESLGTDQAKVEKGTAVGQDPHTKASSLLDESGGGSGEAGICSSYNTTMEHEAQGSADPGHVQDAYDDAYRQAKKAAVDECLGSSGIICKAAASNARATHSRCYMGQDWQLCDVTVAVDCKYAAGGEEGDQTE
jgi:hypothetical protein